MKKGKFDSYNYKANAVLCLQNFINIFLMPLGYYAEFGSNYMRKCFRERFRIIALQELEKELKEVGKCGKN